MANASKGYFAISREASPGMAITTPTHFMPVEEATFEYENEFSDIREIAGSPEAYTSFDGRIAPTATIRGAVYPSGGMGLVLLGLMGRDTTTPVAGSATAFTHAFSSGNLPSFTLERADARNGEGGLLCERMAGAYVESVSFTAAFGEKVDFEASFQVLKKPVTATPVAAGAITYPSEKALVFKGASVEVNDVVNSHFKTINLEIRNTLDRQDALNGSQESYKIFDGGRECTLSGTMVFEDLAMYNRLINGEEFKLELLLQSATVADDTTTPDTMYELKFTWDIVRVARYSLPFRAGEVIEADVDFRVLFNKAQSRSVLIEMTNLDDGTEYDGA